MIIAIVKSVLSSQPVNAQKVAAKGKWLLNTGVNKNKNSLSNYVCFAA